MLKIMNRVACLAVVAVFFTLVDGSSLHAEPQPSIRGMAWYDRNANGVREEDEPLLSGGRGAGDVLILASRTGGLTAQSRAVDGRYTVTLFSGGPEQVRTVQAVINIPVPLEGGSGSPIRPALVSPAREVTVPADGIDGVDLGLVLPETPHDERYFGETGYRVDDDGIWHYFQQRGGVDTFGMPVSRAFVLGSRWVQLFQRHLIQVGGSSDPGPRPANLLDISLLRANHAFGQSFPPFDSAVAWAAPSWRTGDYAGAVQEHLNAVVPNTWEDMPVRFLERYLASGALADEADPVLAGLELWGFPTSQPARDLNNPNVVYQRFQRGVMQFDATTGATTAVPVGDLFKAVLTGEGLPPDLEQDMAPSGYARLYAPSQINGVNPGAARIDITAGASNLAFAF